LIRVLQKSYNRHNVPDLVQLPDSGREIPERRRKERRRWGRRSDDLGLTIGRFSLVPALWALIGSAVVLYLFLVAVGGVKPGDAPALTGVILVAAVLWLGHSWRRVLRGGVSPRGDRERRGF
jgi:hypothetical protein